MLKNYKILFVSLAMNLCLANVALTESYTIQCNDIGDIHNPLLDCQTEERPFQFFPPERIELRLENLGGGESAGIVKKKSSISCSTTDTLAFIDGYALECCFNPKDYGLNPGKINIPKPVVKLPSDTILVPYPALPSDTGGGGIVIGCMLKFSW